MFNFSHQIGYKYWFDRWKNEYTSFHCSNHKNFNFVI